MAESGAEGQDFALTPPDLPVAVKAPRRRASDYSQRDHQWLINLCARHLTLSVFRRLTRGGTRHFKDWPALFSAAVLYFGRVELGWRSSQTCRAFNLHRNTLRSLVARIEDMRAEGDVFDDIEQRIRLHDLL